MDFLINRLNALEEHMKAVEEQMALELDHRQAPEDPQCLPTFLGCTIAQIFKSTDTILAAGPRNPVCLGLLTCAVLAYRRNELVALDLILTAVATAFAFISMVGGIYGA